MKLDFKSTFIEGISKIDSADFKYARELGYTIRLIAIASISKNSVQQRVHPCFIKKSSDVAKVADETNAIIVQDKSIGKIINNQGGCALIIDYGDWHSLGSTLQALKSHKSKNIFYTKFIMDDFNRLSCMVEWIKKFRLR